jgi:hypothetical protein
MTSTTNTRRDLREEAAFLPESLPELMELRERLLVAGQTRRVADGLCMWLLAKAHNEPDTTAPNVRSKYRKVLRELPAAPPPAAPRRRGRGDRGATDPKTAALVGLGAVAGVAVAHLTGQPALALLAPVIPAPESYVEQGHEALQAA